MQKNQENLEKKHIKEINNTIKTKPLNINNNSKEVLQSRKRGCYNG